MTSPIIKYRANGSDVYYPDHPLYASTMLRDAQRRKDTRDVSKWQKRVTAVKSDALRSTMEARRG